MASLPTVVSASIGPPANEDVGLPPNKPPMKSTTITEPSHDAKDHKLPGAPEAHDESTDQAEKAENIGPKRDGRWTSPVTMYCSKNGRSHAILQDFGIFRCPQCHTDLREKKNESIEAEEARRIAEERDRLADRDFNPACRCFKCNEIRRRNHFKHIPLPKNYGEEAGEETSSVHGETGDDKQPTVAYSVEYLDSGGGHIATEPWPTTFNLNTARHNVMKYKATVFSVVTVLKTSQAAEAYRYISPEARAEKVAGVLSDPGIMIKVHATKIIIESQTLLGALRSAVLYYPELDLEGRTLELNEPYAVIGHHLEELERHRQISPAGPQTTEPTPKPDSEHDDTSMATTPEHLGLLLDYLKTNVYKDKIPEERNLHLRGFCTFQMLWLLFKPGTTVYVEFRGNLAAHVVQSIESDKAILSDSNQRLEPYKIRLWSLTFDGRFVGRTATERILPPFGGERAITSLKVFPCEYFDKTDGGKTRRQLVGKGERWYKLLRGRQIRYQGEPFDQNSLEARDHVKMKQRAQDPQHPPLLGPSLVQGLSKAPMRNGSKRGPLNARVYVDPASYYVSWPAMAPDICNTNDIGHNLAMCGCESCHGRRPHPPSNFPYAAYDLLDPLVVDDLAPLSGDHDANHRYLLCDSLLYGIVLKSRSWVALDVSYCFEPNINPTAIDTLVMPGPRKQMIKALVQKFTSQKDGLATSWRADFVENKGEGQLFLLHGGPGVGKTYTAECIAEYTNRPLLSLTCGDIGIDQINMEEQLSKWFRLAEKWGAVMLIDEADVYLERRVVSDLARNSLVSVFLRCIEYYRGILFLTTNRVGHFDDAFISRIHVVIRYDPLNEDDRRQIWTQFFDKLTDERQDFMITGRAKNYVLEDDTIKNLEWNGREIRNAFQTAVALAEFRYLQKADKSKHDCPTLDQKDFEQVCEMTRQFKEYLHDLHGLDEEGRAFNTRARVGNQDWARNIRP